MFNLFYTSIDAGGRRRDRVARPEEVRDHQARRKGGVRHRVEGEEQEDGRGRSAQEDLLRVPERDGRAAHVPRGHVPDAVQPPERDPAPERDQGLERGGHLPGVRLHGVRPAQGDPGRHPAGAAQAIHPVPAAPGPEVPAHRKPAPQRPQAVQLPPGLLVRAEALRLRPREDLGAGLPGGREPRLHRLRRDPLVSPAGAAAWLSEVRQARRHVGRRLHPRRDAGREAHVPGVFRDVPDRPRVADHRETV